MRPSRPQPCTVLCLTLSLLAAGCGHAVYVRGVQVADQVQPEESATIGVREDPAASPAAPEVRVKIERCLADRGYRIAGADAADLLVLYSVEVETLVKRMRLEPTGGVQGGMATVHRKGPYARSLSLRLLRGPAFRDASVEEVLWSGVAFLPDAPTESPKFNDLLVVAALRHFPTNTGDTVTERLALDAPQARRLRRPS